MENEKECYNWAMENEKKCILCGSTTRSLVHKGVRDNSDIDVLCCVDCGLNFLSTDKHISDEFYEEGRMTPPHTKLEAWIKNTAPDDQRRFEFLKNNIVNKIIIDFGCGNGGFLKLANTVTEHAYGVELQKSLTSHFEKNNIKVRTKIDYISQKADIITLFHVLEHIKNPFDFLKGLKPFLKQEGTIIIEVPNADDALLTLYKSKAFKDFTYWGCHLFIYNAQTLEQTAKKAGFKINYVKHIQRYGLMNHLYWLIKKKPGGHKKWEMFDSTILNTIYSLFLKSFKKTDTVLISISPDFAS